MPDLGEDTSLSLVTLDGGGAVEMFDHALQAVLDNLQDPNTDPKAVRQVVMTVKIKPNKGSRSGTLTYQVKPNLAPTAAYEVGVYLGRDAEGRGYASESSPLEEAIESIKAQGDQSERPEASEAQGEGGEGGGPALSRLK